MAGTAENVLVGLGILKIDTVDVGFTQGGVTITVNTDRVDKEVDQSFSPIGIIKVREQYQLATNLAEATLENLKIVWEQSDSPAVTGGGSGEIPSRTLKWGVNEAVIDHTLEFRGNSPEGFNRIFTMFKANVLEIGDMAHVRDAITVIPVTFRILPDLAQAAGEEYGTIVDETTDVVNP